MIKIALLGFKGRARTFYDVFQKQKNKLENSINDKIEIKYILVNDQSQQQEDSAENKLLTTDFEKIILDPEVDIIIELSGEEDLALDFILKSLKKGKIVITAGRKAVAENYKKLQEIKRKNNTEIFFGASTGPIPITEIIQEFFLFDKIKRIEAVLNGSANYILSLMEKETISMKETINKVEDLVQPEIEFDADLEGLDSLYKISIIADSVFKTNVEPKKINFKGIKGITSYDIIYAEELGYKIKLVGTIVNKENEILIGVRPKFIRNGESLAAVDANFNGIEIISDFNKKFTFQASADGNYSLLNVLNRDFLSALKLVKEKDDNLLKNCHVKDEQSEKKEHFDFNKKRQISDLYSELENSFYIRLQVEKEKSNMEEIKDIFSEKDLADLILHDNMTETPLLPVIIITKKIKENRLENILKRIEELDGVLTINNIIPIKNNN